MSFWPVVIPTVHIFFFPIKQYSWKIVLAALLCNYMHIFDVLRGKILILRSYILLQLNNV